jgi:hypothetical protein
MNTQYDVIMCESLLCSFHIMTSYSVSITEQTTAKSYLFVLNNKKTPPPNSTFVDYHFIRFRTDMAYCRTIIKMVVPAGNC